jgi:stage V sporulation protein G
MLNITDVRIKKVRNAKKLKAYASITIDNVFVVHDLKIILGVKGLFVAMPSKKVKNGEFKDIAHPIVTETRKNIQDLVIEHYNKIKDDDSYGEIDVDKDEDDEISDEV